MSNEKSDLLTKMASIIVWSILIWMVIMSFNSDTPSIRENINEYQYLTNP